MSCPAFRRHRLPSMLVFALLAAFAVLAGPARAAPLAVVAAETVWGDIARQVGGADVAVTSILTNPSTDPHLFEASPSDGRVVGAARIVIANGGGYDGWIDRLTDAGARARPAMLVVSRRVGWRDGDNPHFWYDLAAVRTVAAAFAETCAELMPDRRAALQDRLGVFLASLSPLQARIDALRARYAGVPAAASEPIFGAMAHAVGLAMQDEAFQRAVMNGTDPAPSDVAALEGDLTSRHVRVLIVNDQTASPVTDRLDGLARAAGVPVLRVGESLPPGLRYQDWIAGTLDRLSQALAPHPDQG